MPAGISLAPITPKFEAAYSTAGWFSIGFPVVIRHAIGSPAISLRDYIKRAVDRLPILFSEGRPPNEVKEDPAHLVQDF